MRHPSIAILALLSPVLLNGALSGCHVGFTPQRPQIAQAPDMKFELARLDLHGDPTGAVTALRIAVQTHETPPHSRLLTGLLAGNEWQPCAGGYGAARIETKPRAREDSAASLTRPSPQPDELGSGSTITFVFDDEARRALVDRPARLDILVETAAGPVKCISLPVLQDSPSQEYNSTDRWSLGIGFGGEGIIGELEGLRALMPAPLRVGRWVGPVRLTGSIFVGASSCKKSVCPVEGKDGAANGELLYGVGAGLDYYATNLGWVTLGVGARYRIAWTGVETFAGERDFLLHGPVLLPRLSVGGDPRFGHVGTGAIAGLTIDFELPVSYTFSDSGASALGIGAALLFEIAL